MLNKLYRFTLVLLLLINASPSSADQPYSISVDEKSSLPQMSLGGTSVFTSYYSFWAENWRWQYFSTKSEKNNNQYKSQTRYQNLDLFIDTTTSAENSNVNTSIKFDALAEKKITAGGIVFKLNIAALSEMLGQPELLPDNKGWAWGKVPNRIEFKLDKPVKKITFEPGRTNEIRVYFYEKDLPKEQLIVNATLSSPAKGAFAGSEFEKYQTITQSNWKLSPIDKFEALPDLSFLNAPEKPAGKHGFLKAQKSQLVFEDGNVGKFWGTNVTAYALFSTPKEQIKFHAHRLSMLGYNLVRLHHIDNAWVSPNIFGKTPNESTLSINAESQDKLDWWIKCLKDEGIYVWLDLHVDRAITRQDEIDWIEEIIKDKPNGRLHGFNYVNSSIQTKMQAFNTAFLSHVNKYTQTAYSNEPAVIGVMITNENDVTSHYGIGLLPDKKVDKHNAIYTDKANAFAKQWGLPANKVWRAWESGPSKLFLNELEHAFNESMIKHLKSLGVKVPIITTNTWGNNPLSALPALTNGDMIDVHIYQELGAVESNPLYTSNFVHWINAAHVPDKPLSVTEWSWASELMMDRHTLPIMASAYASLQGWDALMQFAYTQSPLGNAPRVAQWESLIDPSVLPTMSAGALLYRQHHLSELNDTYVLALDKDTFYNNAFSPNNSASIRTGSEKGKFYTAIPATPELPWLKTAYTFDKVTMITQANQNLLNNDPGYVRLGPLERNWEKGYLTVNADKSQIATGWIGNQTIALSSTTFNIKNKHATVAVQALDNQAIKDSSDILISLGRLSTSKEVKGDKKTYTVEPLEGTLSIKAKAGLKIYKPSILNKLSEVPFEYKDGQYTLSLANAENKLWLYMR